MKTILCIGLGRFGLNLTRKLIEMGNEVMVVEKDEEKLREFMDTATSVQIGDCTKPEVLESLGVNNFDICFVCVGGDFQASLEITSMLKDMGAKLVVSHAVSDFHAKFLLRNGADDVAYPERDNAYRIAVKYSSSKVFDYVELTKDVSIYEVTPMRKWIGKTIGEVNVRTKYNVTILATKQGDAVNALPSVDYVFREDEHLLILSRAQDIERIIHE